MKQTYNYLSDVTPPKQVQIIEESTDPTSGSLKVVFRALLQTAGEKNQNRRIYSYEVCKSIVEQLQAKAESRSLLMEVD